MCCWVPTESRLRFWLERAEEQEKKKKNDARVADKTSDKGLRFWICTKQEHALTQRIGNEECNGRARNSLSLLRGKPESEAKRGAVCVVWRTTMKHRRAGGDLASSNRTDGNRHRFAVAAGRPEPA